MFVKSNTNFENFISYSGYNSIDVPELLEINDWSTCYCLYDIRGGFLNLLVRFSTDSKKNRPEQNIK